MRLSVAPVNIQKIRDTACLLVERFDRHQDRNGAIRRLHQEDFCRALGFTSDRKYTADGGPRLKDCFDLVRHATTQPARETLKLLDAVIFDIVIGNADAHGKNFGLLCTEGSAILAPLHDVLSTIACPELSPKFAMKVANRSTLEEMKPEDNQTLAEQTGLTASCIRR